MKDLSTHELKLFKQLLVDELYEQLELCGERVVKWEHTVNKLELMLGLTMTDFDVPQHAIKI